MLHIVVLIIQHIHDTQFQSMVEYILSHRYLRTLVLNVEHRCHTVPPMDHNTTHKYASTRLHSSLILDQYKNQYIYMNYPVVYCWELILDISWVRIRNHIFHHMFLYRQHNHVPENRLDTRSFHENQVSCLVHISYIDYLLAHSIPRCKEGNNFRRIKNNLHLSILQCSGIFRQNLVQRY